MTTITILVVLALLFAVLSLIPAANSWPILAVSVIFLAVAMLVGAR